MSTTSPFRVAMFGVPASREAGGAFSGAPVSWAAPALWRFGGGHSEKAEGPAHCKTWRIVPRFMESPLFLTDLLTAHEPFVVQASACPDVLRQPKGCTTNKWFLRNESRMD